MYLCIRNHCVVRNNKEKNKRENYLKINETVAPVKLKLVKSQKKHIGTK